MAREDGFFCLPQTGRGLLDEEQWSRLSRVLVNLVAWHERYRVSVDRKVHGVHARAVRWRGGSHGISDGAYLVQQVGGKTP